MRPKHKLTSKQVEGAKLRRGYYADGDCLYLRVTPSGTKSWALRWRDRLSGKLREMGLGAYDRRVNNLADARERAVAQRRLLANGIDPLAEKHKARDARRQASGGPRFDDHAGEYIAAHGRRRSSRRHRALPYAKLPELMANLQRKSGVAAACLQFTILTACRTSETIGAQWREFDLRANVWTIPGARVKAERARRVPLSSAAVDLLRKQRGLDDRYVFPGLERRTHISGAAVSALMRGIDAGVHGFRSTFRDWAAQTTSTPRQVPGVAPARAIDAETEATCGLGDLFARRRKLLKQWAAFAMRNS